METITKSTAETQALGEKVGANLEGGEIIALDGELGAGKTSFIQGLAKGMGISARIISPTFMIMRSYKYKNGALYHVDLYRIDDVSSELDNLGVTDLWGKSDSVFVIEWANKLPKLPPQTISITLKEEGEDERRIVFKNLPPYITIT